MKLHIFILASLCLMVFSCRKQDTVESDTHNYLENVKNELQGKMSQGDFNNLDFTRAVFSKVDSIHLYFLQVPFLTNSAGEFVLLKTNLHGQIERGKIIQVERNATGDPSETNLQFNGSITIQSLKRTVEVRSTLKRGFMQSSAIPDSTGKMVTPDPYVELPEVIIVCSYSSSVGISWSTWYSVTDMLGTSGGSGGGSWYVPAGGSSGGGSGGGTSYPSSGYNSGYIIEEPIYVSTETQINNPTVNLQNIVDCFNAIPDAGAVCKITIHSDLPVNSDPSVFFNFDSGSPGHAWLRFEKTNGTKTLSHHIGFYPTQGWKMITSTGPLTGKFVDNGSHELNASYEVSITPVQLKNTLARMVQLKDVKYNLDTYNCTDWALEVFNQAVNSTQRLTIPKYIIGTTALDGSNTPQGLFVQLRNMKEKGYQGITMPLVGWAGMSSAPCK